MNKQALEDVERLRDFRDENGLSYPDLAVEIGVNPMTIYRWLKGHDVPSKMGRILIGQFLSRKKRS